MPRVSVIIPAYNGEKFLSRSIGSVLAQTHREIELVVVDDGSTDNTKSVVEEFQKKDPRISYYYEENSGGPARPKNVAMQYTKGDYIAYLDQDDEWMPEKLEKQIALFKESGQDVGLAGCDVFLAREDGRIFGEYKTQPTEAFPALLERNYVYSNSSVLVRRDVIEKVGMRDEQLKYAEDWDMWIRIAAAGYRFVFVHEPLLKYYFYKSNTTKKLGFIARAQDGVYIYNKHRLLYREYKKEGVGLFNIGVRFCLGGDMKMGRTYFVDSLKKSHYNLSALAGIVISFLGPLGRWILNIALETSRFFHGRSLL